MATAAGAASGAVPVVAQRASRLTRERVRYAWIFLAPMLVVLLLVAAWPLGRTIWFGLTDANLSDLSAAQFIGIDNFIYLLQDPDWWTAFWNTVIFTVCSVTLETILGLGIALAINANMPGRGLMRTAVLIPWAIPTIVSAQMWAWMYNDVFGVLNAMLIAVGIIDKPIAWTANPNTALLSVIIVDVWKTTPFMSLLFLAGLQMLPSECYEAAKVDGIHPVRVFWKVTLPLLKPAIMVAVIFRVLDAFRVFDVIYVLTGNNKSTMSMSVYARQQLVDFQDVGYGSAAATMLFLIIAVFTVVYMTLGRVGRED
ncbi:MAG: sugar ABC transporter permease [Geminicoccaceae bacterium]